MTEIRFAVARVILASALALILAGCGAELSPREAARAAFVENDLRSARLHAIAALKEEPQDYELLLLLARSLNGMGDGVGAEAALAKLPENLRKSPDAIAEGAFALLLQERFDDALVAADGAGPTSALAHWVAIGSMLAMGEDELAYARLVEAEEIHRDDAQLLALGGEMALRQGAVGKAAERAEQALANDPQSLPALMLSGKLALLKEDFISAEQHFAAAVASHPTPAAPLVSLAATQADLGKIKDAEAAIEALFALAPDHPQGILLKAKIAFVQGKLEPAHRLLQSAESALRNVPAAQLLAGEIDHLRGNHESAIVRLSNFLDNNPAHLQAATVLAQSYLAVGDMQSAWKTVEGPANRAAASPQLIALASRIAKDVGENDVFAARLSKKPQASDAHLRLARADRAIAAGKWSEAANVYSKLRADGFAENALVLNNSAYAALKQGDAAKALSFARHAHALVPKDPQVQDTLGWILLETGGSAQEALRLIRSALDSRPTDLEIRWHYAVALAKTGRRDEARRTALAVREFARPDQQQLIDSLLKKL